MSMARISRRAAPAPGRHDERSAVLDAVIVGGAGHVGLPLALALARGGMRIGIVDNDESKLAAIAAGRMPFSEAGAQPVLGEAISSGRLVLSSAPDLIGGTSTIVIVIGTPLDEYLSPSLTALQGSLAEIVPYVRDGSLVLLRSTVYPGTTEWLARTLEGRGLRVDVAFCPERIVEGRALEELGSLPQIVGSDTQQAGDRAETFFRMLAPKVIRTTAREAELSKLFTNAWRYMKFAVANQFFTIAQEADVDYSRVLAAIRDDYPRAADLPSPGFAAGPCLLKDTMQLAAFTQNQFVLGHAAMLVNEGLPAFIVEQLARRRKLAGTVVGLLGMAFKAESDDTRDSLSFKLAKLLRYREATVLCTDPYARGDSFLPLDEVVRRSEIVIIGAPHERYRDVPLDGKEIIDIWGLRGTITL
jgi:UDP-N-acetyl-D-mannosaminuronic acid dehydrogenase